jgi:hypothetical protein
MIERARVGVALAGLLAAAPAVAQDPPPDADAPLVVEPGKIGARVHPIADGLVRKGSWSVVRVRVANGGGEAELVASISDRAGFDREPMRYARTVDLPTQSLKDVELTWLVGESSADRAVELVIGGEPGAVQFPVRMLGPEDVGIGVIGDDPLGLGAVRETWPGPVPGPSPREAMTAPRDVRFGLVPIEDLPERAVGWSALDWVVWPDPDPSRLDPRQLDALLGWVAGGGHLLVVVTDGWRVAATAPLADALPAELVGVTDGDTGALVEALGGARDGTLAPISTAVPKNGAGRNTVVLSLFDDGRPAWLAADYGLGTVHLVTADPTVGALRQVPREDLWRRLLWLPPPDAGVAWFTVGPPDTTGWTQYQGPAYFADVAAADLLQRGGPRLAADLGFACPTPRCFPVAGPNADQIGTAYDAVGIEQFHGRLRDVLADIPGVAPLPLSWLAAFAVAYLLAVGPIDYVVLRLIKRQPWTWITFPITVAVFSAAALFGTTWVKGSQAVVNRYEVVDVLPGTGFWRGQTWIGLFATAKSDLVLSSGYPDAVVAPVGDGGFMQDPSIRSTEQSSALSWRSQTWALTYAGTTWTARRPGHVTLRSHADGTVSVENRLGLDLTVADLRARGGSHALGPLSDGATATVDTGLGHPPTADELATFIGSSRVGDPVGDPERAGVSLFANHPEQSGGNLAIEAPIGLVAETATPIEPLVLEGVRPIERPKVVVRVPLVLIPAEEAP